MLHNWFSYRLNILGVRAIFVAKIALFGGTECQTLVGLDSPN